MNRGVVAAALLAAAVAVGGSGSAFAKVGDIDPAMRAEYDAAFQAMLAAPADLDVTFRYADIALRAGDPEGAIGALERMLIFNPNLPRVRLELGLIYFRLGSYDIAEAYFRRALEGTDVPAEVRTRVEGYLAEIAERQSPHQFSGQVLAGLRLQTNANAGTDADTIRLNLFGTPVNAIPGSTSRERSDASAFASVTATHRYDFGTEDGTGWLSRGTFYNSRQRHIRSLDIVLLDASTGPSFTLDALGTDDLGLRPYVAAGHVWLGDTPYFHSIGLGAEASLALGDDWLLRSELELRDRHFRNRSERPNASEKTGVETRAALSATYALDSAQAVRAELNLRRDNASAAFESSREAGIAVGYTAAFGAPVSFTGSPWTASASAAYSWRRYDAPDPVIDPTLRRRDRELQLTGSLSVPFGEGWSALLELQQTWSNSNLPNFEFDNSSALIGAAYRF